ncbi:hypothetical protein JCM10449v2_007756 [Rhodotorula kratochvilovae]
MSKSLVVGGLPVSVYGLEALTQGQSDVAVCFLLHGRMGRAAHPLIDRFAQRLVAYAAEQRAHNDGWDLIVVTFDQRNHGHREVDRERNLGWAEGGKKHAQERKDKGVQDHELDNVAHAVDMMAIQTGTARDVSFLIDFLPSALFPHDERTVADWFCAGISLGGHATWLALAHEPRITLGVPIIGSPSTHTLLTHRAVHLPAPQGPLPLSAPYFPASLLALLAREDPANVPFAQWDGRRVLVLSGENDKLVNYVDGGSEAFVERLKTEANGVTVEAWVQPQTGHACTPEMIERTCEFLWREGLARSSGSSAAAGAGRTDGKEGVKGKM